jgi:hypothetical protein
VVLVRLILALALFSLLAAQASAYDVAIKVTVAQGTLAVGTNVTVMQDDVELYSQKAGMDGVAHFQLDPGSYLVVLQRGGYPDYVSILEVSGVTNVTRTMSQGMSYASAYGQIKGPTDFSNVSIAAFTGGDIVKRVSPNKDGYYLMPYLPGGEYELVFGAPGFAEVRKPVSLMPAVYSKVNAKLEKPAAEPEGEPRLVVPASAGRDSAIEVMVYRGNAPAAGAAVLVSTPAGSFEAIADSTGIVRVNAAQPGKYKFSYGALQAITTVEAGMPEPPLPPEQELEPEAPGGQEPEPQEQGGWMGAVAALAIAGGVVALLLVAAAAIMLLGRKGGKAKEEKPAEPHAKKHEHAHHAKHAHHKK